MEELNKNIPASSIPATNPTSESTEDSLEFELLSKKDKKFPLLAVISILLLISLITVGALVYLKIITLPFELPF